MLFTHLNVRSAALTDPYPHRARGILFAAATAFLWGLLAIALKYSLKIADVTTIACFRFLFAFVALAALLRARRPGALAVLRRPPPLALLAAVLLTVNYVTFFKGIELMAASTAQVLIQTSPLIFAGIGVLFFKERLRRPQRVGFLVAAGGVALFYRDQLAQIDPGRYRWGLLSIGAASVTWALWATIQKLLTMRGHRPQALNVLTYGVAGVLLLPFADLEPLGRAGPWQWVLLCALGANTLLAYGALGEALKHAPANQVSMIITLNPLLTLAAMALLAALDVAWVSPEPVAVLGYVGAAFMVGGVLLVVRQRSS
jgi:drug/metabolite transporter (DMT)-like permease